MKLLLWLLTIALTKGMQAPNFILDLQTTSPFVVADAETFDYVLTLENAGSIAATNVQIMNAIPAGTAFVSASHSGAYNNGVIVWSGLTIAPGETVTLTFQLRPHPGTLQGTLKINNMLVNTVSATSAQGVSIPETAFTTPLVKQIVFFPMIYK